MVASSIFHRLGADTRFHSALVCAHNVLQRNPKLFEEVTSAREELDVVDVKVLGCARSDEFAGTIVLTEVKSVSPVGPALSSYLLGPNIIYGIGALILALAIYGIVRAIGWVIGGFAAV
jgi:hypothetical protein